MSSSGGWTDAPGPAVLRGPAGTLAVTLVADPTLARGTVVVPFGDPRRSPNRRIGVERARAVHRSADLERRLTIERG